MLGFGHVTAIVCKGRANAETFVLRFSFQCVACKNDSVGGRDGTDSRCSLHARQDHPQDPISRIVSCLQLLPSLVAPATEAANRVEKSKSSDTGPFLGIRNIRT